MNFLTCAVVVGYFTSTLLIDSSYGSPNIIFILMDDMGFSDMSARGSEFTTPSLDELYKESIVLNSHYIGLLCSPSRSQILTGRYAWNMGISSMAAFGDSSMVSMPLGIPTIADLLNEYTDTKSYALGKWHVGYATKEHTPLYRGFKGFYGFLTSGIGYTDKKKVYSGQDLDFVSEDGYMDWRKNENIDYETQDEFSTFVTGNYLNEIISLSNKDESPFFIYAALQGVHESLETVDSINVHNCNKLTEGSARRLMCENILAIDQVIGEMVENLKANDIWDNTLIIFTTDNGGDGEGGSCNSPLRGEKGLYFEGGVHTLAFVGGGYIDEEQRGTTRDEFMHGVDWLPTLLSIAGADVVDIKSKLQSKLYVPVSKIVSENSGGSKGIGYQQSSTSGDYLMDESLDGHDYSRWLLYGEDMQTNARTDVPLSIHTMADLEADTSERDMSGDVAIVFVSKYTHKTYKFMDLFQAPANIFVCEYRYDEFSQSYIAGNDAQTSPTYISSQLLFDLSLDSTESINLVESVQMTGESLLLTNTNTKDKEMSAMNIEYDITDLSDYDLDLVELLWSEAVSIIESYQSNVMFNDYIRCFLQSLNEANPVYFDEQVYQPYFETAEYVSKFELLCAPDGEINDVLYQFFVTNYNDYSDSDHVDIDSAPARLSDEVVSSVSRSRNYEKEGKSILGIHVQLTGETSWQFLVIIISVSVIAVLVISYLVYKYKCENNNKTATVWNNETSSLLKSVNGARVDAFNGVSIKMHGEK